MISSQQTILKNMLSMPLVLRLTARESEVLFFVTQGHTAKRIGLDLKISHRTVEKYIENLKAKFNCQTRAELLFICMSDPAMRAKILGKLN